MMDGGSLWKEGFARVNVGALACVTVLLLCWNVAAREVFRLLARCSLTGSHAASIFRLGFCPKLCTPIRLLNLALSRIGLKTLSLPSQLVAITHIGLGNCISCDFSPNDLKVDFDTICCGFHAASLAPRKSKRADPRSHSLLAVKFGLPVFCPVERHKVPYAYCYPVKFPPIIL